MKKLGFLLVCSAILVSSCKKSYTCTCTTTGTFGTSTSITIIPDATQGQAQTICIAGEVYGNGGSADTKCKL